MHGRLAHDAAHQATLKVLRVFGPLLREEEQQDAYEEIMPIVTETLTRFSESLAREQARLSPAKPVVEPLG
jgi:hypothetical protein